MPLAIVGTNFDKAFQQHAHAKSLKDKDWAKNQLRLLAEVTMKERRQRALRLGYQIAELVGELNDWEEQWEPQRKHQSNTDAELQQAKSELLGDLFEDAGNSSPRPSGPNVSAADMDDMDDMDDIPPTP